MNVRFAVTLLLFALVFSPRASANGRVYVANEDDGTISVIDPARSRVVKVIDTMETGAGGMKMFRAHNVQVSPNGKQVWVTAAAAGGGSDHGDHAASRSGGGNDDDHGGNNDADQIIVIDAERGQITARVNLGAGLHVAHVVLDEQGKSAFVTATETDEIHEIDAATFEARRVHKLRKGAGPHGARICGDKLFVAQMKGNSLAVIELSNGEITEVPVGGVAVQAACTKDGALGFVSLFDTREVVRYDTRTGELRRIALPPGSQGPAQITISPDNTRLYVADQGILLGRPASNLLHEIDLREEQVVATVRVGAGAHGIAVSADGSRAYVTNQAENTVSVVELATRRVLATIRVGKKPNGISVL